MNSVIARSRLFDDFFKDFSSGYFVRPLHGDPLPNASLVKVDVKDIGDSFLIHADIPGVKKEDIQVHIDGSVVSLGAEIVQQESQNVDGKLLHSERYAGAVSRSFNLPCEVDQSKAKAKYENGVLILQLPKLLANKPLRVNID